LLQKATLFKKRAINKEIAIHRKENVRENKVLYLLLGGFIMGNGKQIRITSTEMAQLWSQYSNDSGRICVLTFIRKG
jgi:hypothetical protein